jgi:hypothetical protein
MGELNQTGIVLLINQLGKDFHAMNWMRGTLFLLGVGKWGDVR